MAELERVWNPVPEVMVPLFSPGPAGTPEAKKKKKVSRSYGALRRADTFFSDYPMKWKRVLGMGGFGIAVKYERTGPDGHIDDVVVKVDKNATQEREWTWCKRLEGSEHIPQLIDNLSPTHEMPDVPQGMSTFVLGARRLIVMECLEYGDLRGLLERQTEHYLKTGEYRYTPNRLLWSFFLCLARSCMALAWTRKSAEEVSAEFSAMEYWYLGGQPHPDWKPPSVPETRRERPQETPPSRIVHFDMDPLNVLVGNPSFSPEGDKEHESVPILKLTDFGITTEFTGQEYTDDLEKYRHWGKNAYQAPEQSSDPIHQDTFTGQTNVWGVGIIMFSVITRCVPRPDKITAQDARFMCKRDTARDEEGDEKMGEGNEPGMVEKVVQGTVHARALGILEDGSEPFGDVDADLRVLVARCMCEDPDARPTLAELEAELTQGLDAAIRAEAEQVPKRPDAAGDAGVGPVPTDGPEYLREFVQHFFRDAPARPDDKDTWLPSRTPRWVFSDDMQDWNALRGYNPELFDLLAPSMVRSLMRAEWPTPSVASMMRTRWGTPELTDGASTSAGTGDMLRTMFRTQAQTDSASTSAGAAGVLRTMFETPEQTDRAGTSAGTGAVMRAIFRTQEHTERDIASVGTGTGIRAMFRTRGSPEQLNHPEWYE